MSDDSKLSQHDRPVEDSGPQPDGFLRQRAFVTHTPGSLSLQVVEFSPELLTAQSFAQAGIDCPESIRRAVAKRRAEFLFGRVAARAALAALGISNMQVGVGARRQPLWPRDVIGSITHTHGLAAAAAERPGVHHGIGIDAEQMMSAETCRAVAATVVDAQELDYLKSLPERALPEWMTIVFSAKESFYKAVHDHVGRFFDFSAVRVTELDARARRLTLLVAEALSDALQPGRVCHAGYDFMRDDVVLTHVVW